MRAEYTRRGGRYRAEERGALEVERESGEADAEDDPLPPALKIWANRCLQPRRSGVQHAELPNPKDTGASGQ